MAEPPFRALLIGVPSYKDERITDLPFIRDDLAELEAALAGAGYAVEVHDTEQTGRDEIESAVEIFFQEALPGQTLLLFLSGHGIHHDDMDYLVPRGALTRVHDFPGKCVAIDFGPYAERSLAGDVAVFVDACREGIDLREKSVGNVLRWSETRVRRVGNRHYCHVYACSKGEFARYASTGNSTFSLFSRALSTLVADETGPSTLGALQERLQAGLDALTSQHECQRQQVRVRTETGLDDFVLFERPEPAAPAPGESPWTALAREHPAWQQAGDGPGIDLLREATTALVDQLSTGSAADERLLAEDPWSATGFAERMTERVSWLLSKVLNPQKLQLSPAEAALLVALPFLHTAHRNRVARRALSVRPTDLGRASDPSPERAAFERYCAGHSRLVRRARRAAGTGDAAGAAGIAWWLFHHWLMRQPLGGDDRVLAELTASPAACRDGWPGADGTLAAEVFDRSGLPALLAALRSSPDLAADRPVRQLAGASPYEQGVRDEMVAVLLTVAQRMAIDPLTLGDVVVDHVGISYSVDLPGLHRTLSRAVWDPLGRTRVLRAVCGHPAVGLALQQQAAGLDALLGAVDVLAGTRPQLAPLVDLPVHATADQVSAAQTPEGKRVYESTDLRFRLADDRIQELLMGEELYGDPALAVRELYQNALDACRYRDARTAYLRATGRYPYGANWQGRIAFTQGEEGGRPYIECTDNGIGMGERELREVFSHAGMRFADLPEYAEELAAWRAENIDMHPNSRFGIGVLSYFMIADDITVTTCRLDRDGLPGRRLRVDIAGPGALFHIQDLGRGHDAGTTVRLYVRDPDHAPSCTDLLRRLLWVSDFHVTATDLGSGPGKAPLTWRPGELSEVAPLGAEDPHADGAVREPGARVARTTLDSMWWCSTTGAVLADGLWSGTALFGAVVNLTGRYAPQLTVDRKRCLSYDEAHVRQLLRSEIPALLQAGGAVLTPNWLTDLALTNGFDLADEVLARAVATDHRPWGTHKYQGTVGAVGCFAADTALFEPRSSAPWPLPDVDNAEMPEHVVEWRVLAWAKAGAYPGVRVTAPDSVPLARPIDSVLLHRSVPRSASDLSDPLRIAGWLRPAGVTKVGHVLQVADRLGLRPGEVVERLAQLGHRLPGNAVVPDTVRGDDLVLLRTSREEWLAAGELVSPARVLRVAKALRRRPTEVAEHFAALGHDLPEWAVLPEVVPDDDPLPAHLGSRSPVLSPGFVLEQARRSRISPEVLVERLAELGYRLPECEVTLDEIGTGDLCVMSRDLYGSGPWLDVTAPVPPMHIVAAAQRLGARSADVVARLAKLGYRAPAGLTLPERASAEERILLSLDAHGEAPWLADGDELSLQRVLIAAARAHLSPVEVITRWERFGLRVPQGFAVPERADADDLLLLSEDLDRARPWLDARQPLPLGHVLEAAALTGRDPADVAARLGEFGHRLPDRTPVPAVRHPDDVTLLSRQHSLAYAWLQAAHPVPLAHIVRVAAVTGRLPAEVATRLAELGYQLPATVAFTHDPDAGAGP